MDAQLIRDDRKENIKMFQGMEKQFLYSKYSGELNQIFGEKSFNYFYTNLLSARKKYKNKISNIENYNSPDSKYKNNPLQNVNFDIKSYKHFIKDLNKELKLEEKKRKKYKENLKLIKKEKDNNNKNEIKLIFKKKKNKYEVPSIGWYHPNYKSIRKNERTIYIGNGYNEKKKKKKTIYSPQNENNRRKSRKILKIFNRKNRNLSEEKIKSKFILDDSNNKSNINITNYLTSRNNALKFDQYSSRKPLITESLTTNIVSNINKVNSFSTGKLRGLIEFNKMSSNLDFGSFIPKQSSVPPIGFYKPKYETIQSKSPDIFLCRNHTITKQMKLKKLLYEYNIPKEYKLITNLND